MLLPIVDFSTAVSDFIVAMQAVNPNLTDTSENSVCLAFAEASAHNLQTLQNIAVNLLAVTRLATSNGSDCDTFGADFGFFRQNPTYATGLVTFSRASANNIGLVPVGAQVQSLDGTQTYTVTQDITNLAWNLPLNGYALYAGTASITVPVIASNSGTQANVGVGTITVLLTAMIGVDYVTNTAAFTNASPEESDAAFKSRFVLFINSRSSGTVPALEYAITSYQQGMSYNVLDGVNLSGVLTPANVYIYVDDGSGNTPQQTLTGINYAVNAVRSAGISVYVYPAVEVLANINFTLNVISGINKPQVIATINQALPIAINSLPVGTPLTFYSLPSIIYNAAVGQITSIESLTINGGTSDIGGAGNQVVRLSTLTVS